MKFVLIGAGQRGMIYARYANKAGHQIVAAADIDAKKLQLAQSEFNIADDFVFTDAAKLLERDCMADAAIIATMDRDHAWQAILALERGYHLLLEKPISSEPSELLKIESLANERGRHVVVCHVLRYSPFFLEVKKHIDNGAIGRIISIQHNENIGNYHMAHSFVRGNWRRKELASSIIMQKSCHDMDLLSWLVGSPCKKVASFGELTYFKAENAPADASTRCVDCPHADTCRFSAYKCYLPVMGSWPAAVLTENQTEEGLREAIGSGAYGRCVYHCDNDVCDHQVTILEFENGVTSTFNMSAFTNKIARTIKIMGEDGEIRASEVENIIEITSFASNSAASTQSCVIRPETVQSGHGGGDSRMLDDFLALIEDKTEGKGEKEAATSISQSTESHLMALCAEESRLTGNVMNVREYKARHSEEITR
ncbi:MAG: Gfo/Idh/MocA family oxidoreductase [Oscillospiraceae bacterium]|jgi:predicted dehydrogenase|nr:Gfo/Idh/MocA family oxidoreductase [Oscillospiraceae bacterium]